MTSLPAPSCGQFDGPVHRYAVRVYFEDTDAGGIVYHANYLRWFERARSDMLRLLGIHQGDAIAAGEGVYVVSDLAMKFLGPARLDDVVTIESRVEKVQRVSVRLHQVASIEGTVLNEAQVRVGFVTPDGLPRRQPQAWLDAFNDILEPSQRIATT